MSTELRWTSVERKEMYLRIIVQYVFYNYRVTIVSKHISFLGTNILVNLYIQGKRIMYRKSCDWLNVLNSDLICQWLNFCS